MQDPDFVEMYRRSQKDLLEGTVSHLQSLSSEATRALERNLNCGNPSVEIRTATIILDQSIKGMEILGLQDRVEYVEALVRAMEERDEQIKKESR